MHLSVDNDYGQMAVHYINIIRPNVCIIFACYAAIRPYNMQILYGRMGRVLLYSTIFA